MGFVRKEKRSIEYVLSKAISEKTNNYELFKEKGTKCMCCGLEGKFFVKERKNMAKTFRFYLYGIGENGEEIMMTKDHIVPKSRGGENCLKNYQAMCSRCNEEKRSMNEKEFEDYLSYKNSMSNCDKDELKIELDRVIELLKKQNNVSETGLNVELGRQAKALKILINKFDKCIDNELNT